MWLRTPGIEKMRSAAVSARCRLSTIFLSYGRSDDEPFVRRLYERLKRAGLDVWFDRVSMPSRQLTFFQEIRDAISASDRLALVVGPDAVASEYVTQEWQFAYFGALKCVNPIVRLDGEHVAGKTIDGYAIIPEDLRLVHAEDSRETLHHRSDVCAEERRQSADP
jgi:hypothetical protein